MTTPSRVTSRSTGESVVRAFAELGGILALTVLGTCFMVAAAHGHDPGMFLLHVGRPALGDSVPSGYGAPHAFGSVVTLAMVGLGLAVLLVGAIGPRRRHPIDPSLLREPRAALDLP